ASPSLDRRVRSRPLFEVLTTQRQLDCCPIQEMVYANMLRAAIPEMTQCFDVGGASAQRCTLRPPPGLPRPTCPHPAVMTPKMTGALLSEIRNGPDQRHRTHCGMVPRYGQSIVGQAPGTPAF